MPILALLVLLTSQIGFSPAAMMTSPCLCVQNPDVKKELKLNRDQGKKIDGVLKEINEEMKNAQKSMALAGMKAAMEAGDAKVWEILDDTQDQRLRELILQMKGAMALTEEATSKELGLSEEQVAKIKELKSKASKDWMGHMQAGSQSGMKKGKDVMDQLEKDAVAVLTTEQQAKYTKMLGKIVKNLRLTVPPL